MNIHEYQAKGILKEYSVLVPEGYAAFTAEEAKVAATRLTTDVYVVKAQIHAGGRGKAGGVKLVKTPDEVAEIASKLLGKNLVTHQTGPEGQVVRRIYVESGSKIKKEYYLSLILDRVTSRVVIMASAEGGVDIEEVAEHSPEKIFRAVIDPAYGYSGFYARKIGYALGFSEELIKKFTSLLMKLYRAFIEKDVMQLEINPLVVTESEELVALDAKFGFDDNALYRHPEIMELRDEFEEDELEIRASKSGLSYVKLDGNIGCVVNGAGLAMATLDIIALYGATPANFLDVGGGADKAKVTEAFKIILSDENVEGILVNIFGGIMRCDIIAEGVIAAAKEIGIQVPLVVRLEGTNVELGKEILSKSGMDIIAASDLDDAAKKVVEAVKNRHANKK